MDVKQLVASCVEVYKAFKPSVMSVDTHAEEWLNHQGIEEEGDRVFIHQVFYGLVRYKKLIKVVISSFFNLHGHEISRLDQDDFMVLVYLVVLRLEEMTWKEFMRFINSFDSLRMLVFLSFIFDEDNIQTYFRDEWLKIYNIDFVDNVLIAGLLEHIQPAQAVIEKLRAKVGPADANGVRYDDMDADAGADDYEYGEGEEGEGDTNTSLRSTGRSRGKRGKGRGQATQPEPFNLTKPHVAKVPEPEQIPSTYKAQSVPSTTYTEDMDTVHALEAKKREFRRKKREEYEEAKPFSFVDVDSASTMSRSGKGRRKKGFDPALDADLDELVSRGSMTARERGSAKPKTRANPHMPKYPDAPPVKLTVAQILREDALFKKKQEEEMKILQAYERELRDPTEYLQRIEQLKIEDEAKRAAELERRKIDAQISAEEAAAAKVRAEEEKKRMADEVREEKRRLREEAEKARRLELQRGKQTVNRVQRDIREGARQKKRQMEEDARKMAEQMAEERKAAEIARRVKQAKEKRKKADQIKEIRAAEMVPKKPVKEFDRTATAGHGLLEEMSLTEAKERLQMNKRREEAFLEDRREQLLAERQARDARIVAKLNALSRYRSAADREAAVRAERLEEHRKKAIEQEERRLDDHRLLLQRKLEQKRVDRTSGRKKLAVEERKAKIRNQLKAGDTAALEEQSYLQLERAAERTTKARQDKRLTERKQSEEARARASQSKTMYKKVISDDQRRKDEEHRKRVESSKKEANEKKEADEARRQEIVSRERARYAAQQARGRDVGVGRGKGKGKPKVAK